MIYEDDKYECFLIGNPRSNGHAAISTKKHYKDMIVWQKAMDLVQEVYRLVKLLPADASIPEAGA